MKYIVWRQPYISYGIPQGDGYFVKYKNKLCDEFSTNWFEANRYKNIGDAINRLGLDINDSMFSVNDFLEQNKITSDYHRLSKISEILNDSDRPVIRFGRGHIDLVDDDNNFIGNAGAELIKYIEGRIEQNYGKRASIEKKFKSLGVGNYIDDSISDEDFFK